MTTPTLTAPLTTAQFHRITRALSDPTRYEMLRRIYASSETIHCGAACDALTITAATGSHHLRELELAELISVVKDGRFKRLSPRREIWKAYLAQLSGV